MQAKKSVSTKAVVLLLALVLLLGCGLGGTLAWLSAKTDPVVNTFTAGNIKITLTEEGAVNNAQSFKMVPGIEIEKKPVVSVLANSEECWLFVKVEESATVATYLTYSVDSAIWQPVPGESGVFFKNVSATDAKAGVSYDVLTGDIVTVNSGVTQDQMDAVTDATAPKLTFTAYAVQKYGFDDVADAWDEAEKLG